MRLGALVPGFIHSLGHGWCGWMQVFFPSSMFVAAENIGRLVQAVRQTVQSNRRQVVKRRLTVASLFRPPHCQ